MTSDNANNVTRAQVIKMTPDVKLSARNNDHNEASDHDPANKSDLLDDEEDFFDFITRFVVVKNNSLLMTSST